MGCEATINTLQAMSAEEKDETRGLRMWRIHIVEGIENQWKDNGR